jgi:hypothetical protein
MTVDSVGGNSGILQNGATVELGQLTLSGLGTGTAANLMAFTNPIAIGANFGAVDGEGVTSETWYTDTGTGTWGKLFHFGTNAAGQELGYTHMRGNGEMSGIDRDGAKLFNEQVSLNEEHHLVVTVTADGDLNAWVDGEKKVTNSDTNDLANVGTDFEAIGATSWNDPGMTGTVNEFRIWEGTLSPAEVAASLASGPNTLFVIEDSDTDDLPDSYELAQEGITDLTQLDGTKNGPGPGANTGDFDGDGLTDLEELSAETDPTKADTDEDGLDDGPEVKLHLTDPLNNDSDGDTLLDGAEVNTHNTSPILVDTDGDFYNDDVEVANSTLPDDANSPAPFVGTQLAHRWSFTTGAQELADSVGGNTAILFGDPELTGNQINFDGLEIGPDADSFGFTEEVGVGDNYFASGVTLETWYTDSGTGTWGKLAVFGNGTDATNFNYNLQRGPDNVSSIQYPGADFSDETRPALNEEHHLALTITPGGEVNAWIDGQHVNTGDPLGDGVNLGTIPATFERVGASAWNDAGMSGSVNEFRVWKGTLSAENVAENFTNGPDILTGGSGLEITASSHNPINGSVTLTFNSIAGRTYRIDRSPDLISWLDVEEGLVANADSTTFVDNTANGPKLFYRIVDVSNQ